MFALGPFHDFIDTFCSQVFLTGYLFIKSSFLYISKEDSWSFFLKRIFRLIIFVFFLVCSRIAASEYSIASQSCPDEYCECEPYFDSVNSTITLRRIEPKGLGYKTGYTTLTGLFFPGGLACNTVWPFIDLRAHYFNNREWAANAGLGIRYAPDKSCYVFGVNAFGDFRESRKFCYFQTGLGLELLGECWDFRVNGYLSIDPKRTVKRCFFTYPGGFFIKQNKFQSAMPGISGEVGRYICRSDCYKFYVSLGPYYYAGDCKDRIGGRFRTYLEFSRNLILQGMVYYDNKSKFIIQGLIGLYFNFGCAPKCCRREQIISQPVYRNEIIVLDEFCKWKFNF